MYEPVLLALADGKSHSAEEVRAFVAKSFKLSDVELRERPKPDSPHTALVNRVATVFRVGKAKGIIEGPDNGPYRITSYGQAVLANKPVRFSDRPLTLIQQLGLESPRAANASRKNGPIAVPPSPTEIRIRLSDPRPFDPTKPPNELISTGDRPSHDDIIVLVEQARQGHHRILVTLSTYLQGAGWTEVEEIPGSIDLRAYSAAASATIFEAKTISDDNETHQCRAALAQLLEYRIRFGEPEHNLCLAVDRRVRRTRLEILNALEVAVVLVEQDFVRPLNRRARTLLGE